LPLAASEYDSNMRRLLHTALGVWFLIAMTMAQGCAGPAQSGFNSARDANSPSNAAAGNGSTSQWATAMRPQANAHLSAQGYVADAGASTALTGYLKQHRLPLVGAQVLRNPNDGSRAVVLYGFVGSDFGKSDAQRKAEDYINDASVDVDNRIRVNPELLSAGSSSTGSAGSSGNADANAQDSQTPSDASAVASMPGVQSYVDQQNQEAQVQQYQQQNSMSGVSSMLPLIALLGILSMEMAATSSGGFAGGPAMGGYPRYGSPFGTSPYGSPYGSPFSGYSAPVAPPYSYSPSYGPRVGPGYGSPGGSVTPYGSLPGSPYYPSP
jgi:hypothetical protein